MSKKMNTPKTTKTPNCKSSSTHLTDLFYGSVGELMEFSPEVLERQRENERFVIACLDAAIEIKQREESEYEARKARKKAMEDEDIEQETLTALKKIAARDKAKERAKLNTFTARILRPKAKPMVTKTHASKGDRVGQAALNQLLHTPVGELLKRSQQDLRAKREQVLLALRWINGVIAMKTEEEARL
jgi:hypothetical protein